MSAAMKETELITKRAKTAAAMGMVERDYEGFTVTSPGFRKESFRVWKDEEGRVQCSCPEFAERSEEKPRFRCEHILAVKYFLEPPDEIGEEETEEPEETERFTAETASAQGNAAPEDNGRVIPFSQVLKELSQALTPEMVKQRVGWRDRNGREHEVDYVEWHTVADLLDRICPDWAHEVVQIKQIGDYVAVTAAITIRGVTRQGIGTGSAYDEVGIKKAEHDALKRAAVKFGIARELYRREDEIAHHNGKGEEADANHNFPRDPVAKTMADLVTPKQLVAIRTIAKVQGVNEEAECQKVMNCKPEELSRRAASAFIDYLKQHNAQEKEVRQAGG
ncbi:MAG TPA: Rad52/Rad22 family DNA repair protein [Blastocatellia bacterium]|nr:Rad52/Rad22 family DNA repair protein [Blastocatellia bacterium]